jgi:uncharacterized protein
VKDKILSSLRQIEQTHQVIILYACEAGSRAYGLASEKSDYDVRFIYTHPKKKYLSIDPVGTRNSREVIDKIPTSPKSFDISGWEITKSLRLYRKSNPSILEWLHSPIVYEQTFSTISQMKELFPDIFNSKVCILHYVNMAHGNFNKVQRDQVFNVKTFVNIFRPILAAKWIEQYKEFPPLNFSQLVDKISQKGKIKENLNLLINHKLNVETSNQIDYQTLLQYSYDEIQRIKIHALSLEINSMDLTDRLNNVFRETLFDIENHLV